MMNFHRLRELRFAALRPVDFRPEVLPALERLRALPLRALAVWHAVFLSPGEALAAGLAARAATGICSLRCGCAPGSS